MITAGSNDQNLKIGIMWNDNNCFDDLGQVTNDGNLFTCFGYYFNNGCKHKWMILKAEIMRYKYYSRKKVSVKVEMSIKF